MSKSFVHLHGHSHYSLLDGGAFIDGLCKAAKQFGMPALALTDHGNIFGAIEFYETCKKVELKPILGCEMYAGAGRRERIRTQRGSSARDLTPRIGH